MESTPDPSHATQRPKRPRSAGSAAAVDMTTSPRAPLPRPLRTRRPAAQAARRLCLLLFGFPVNKSSRVPREGPPPLRQDKPPPGLPLPARCRSPAGSFLPGSLDLICSLPAPSPKPVLPALSALIPMSSLLRSLTLRPRWRPWPPAGAPQSLLHLSLRARVTPVNTHSHA